jgi:hypothetical protein
MKRLWKPKISKTVPENEIGDDFGHKLAEV